MPIDKLWANTLGREVFYTFEEVLCCVSLQGLWDDLASKILLTDQIRSKIVEYGIGCLDTLRRWRRSEGRIDAGIVWNVYGRIWPTFCEVIELPKDLEILRSTNVAVLQSCTNKTLVQGFVDFLRSDDSRRVYEKWGWITNRSLRPS